MMMIKRTTKKKKPLSVTNEIKKVNFVQMKVS